METFTVEAVLDGNTFEVSPKWKYEGTTGDLVEATGYFPPKLGKSGMAAEQKLSILIHNKKVGLGTPQGIQRNRLVCEVYFRDVNLADYFSEYRKQGGEEEKPEEQVDDEDSPAAGPDDFESGEERET